MDWLRLIWLPSRESGDELDAEHRGLVDEMNALWVLIVAERPVDELCEGIEALYRKMVRHFRDEERRPQHGGYPDLAAHIQLQNALPEHANALIGDFRWGRADLGALSTFLAHEVVVGHIVGADRAYLAHIKSGPRDPQGVARGPARTGDGSAQANRFETA